MLLASRCEFTAAGLIAATVKPIPSGFVTTSVGRELANRLAEGEMAGVAPIPTESGGEDSLSASMPPLGSLTRLLSPNVVW